MPEPDILKRQPCPMCRENSLTLMEHDVEVPYFGKMSVFSMTCENCKFHKADVEALEKQEPCKWVVEISGQEDLKIRIIKSSEATVKIPYITDIEPGSVSQGYITNIEGLLRRVKSQLESLKETAEDNEDKQQAWKLIKKLNRVMWGDDKAKIIIEDPSGNSAIISEKAKKTKL